MSEDNDALTRRRRYKQYLQDDDVSLLESTIRSRRKREQVTL